jgi:hypothetical protein
MRDRDMETVTILLIEMVIVMGFVVVIAHIIARG